jgi:hypothetical protein
MSNASSFSRASVCCALVGVLLASCGHSELVYTGGPDEDPTPGGHSSKVVVGGGLFERSVVLNDKGLGGVTDIIRNPTQDATLGIAGLEGAVFLKADRSVISRVTFEQEGRRRKPSFMQFVATNTKGVWEFLDRGGHGWSDGALYGKDGQQLWVYGGMPGLDDLAAGDLDGDGRPEFVAGFNGAGGLRCLDDTSRQLWQKPGGNIWHVEIVDTDGDGQPEIVHTGGAGGFVIRDRHGKYLREMIPGGPGLSLLRPYCASFSLCRWPDEKGPFKILAVATHAFGTSQILLCGFDGTIIGRYPLPDPKNYREVYGTALRRKKDEPPLLAVVCSHILDDAEMLVVFNAKREIIYQETSSSAGAALLAVPSAVPGTDDLLVGWTNTVWQYSFAKPARAPAAVKQPTDKPPPDKPPAGKSSPSSKP